MFGFLKKRPAATAAQAAELDRQAEGLLDTIVQLEQQLARDPQAAEAQKALMLAYNRALPVFARSSRYRQEMDALFVKIDALRNTIRTSVQGGQTG